MCNYYAAVRASCATITTVAELAWCFRFHYFIFTIEFNWTLILNWILLLVGRLACWLVFPNVGKLRLKQFKFQTSQIDLFTVANHFRHICSNYDFIRSLWRSVLDRYVYQFVWFRFQFYPKLCNFTIPSWLSWDVEGIHNCFVLLQPIEDRFDMPSELVSNYFFLNQFSIFISSKYLPGCRLLAAVRSL